MTRPNSVAGPLLMAIDAVDAGIMTEDEAVDWVLERWAERQAEIDSE